MNLSDVFTAVAHKELVAVDLPHAGSNQHELNGVAALKDLFGTDGKTRGRISWHYFADDHEPAQEENDFTFYDARAKTADKTGRSEWRFYYYGNFLSCGDVGDLLVLARSAAGRHYGLIFRSGSAWRRAAQELFGLRDFQASFDAIPRRTLDGQRFELLRQQIVAELDLDLVLPVAPSDEDLMLKKFGRAFPTTREVSAFARTQVEIDYKRTDETLARWLEREEQLFRAHHPRAAGAEFRDGGRVHPVFAFSSEPPQVADGFRIAEPSGRAVRPPRDPPHTAGPDGR